MKEITKEQVDDLFHAAREGTEKAFLTKPGGNAYGAAVLTSSGKIFSSGQYSSFNHITNIHAEMAATLLATMSGNADIIAIALLSTKAVDTPESMCGVCRQFLYEHAMRTGLPIRVYLSTFSSSIVNAQTLEELIPHQWDSSRTRTKVTDSEKTFSGVFPGTPPVFCYGMLVMPKPDIMGIVWEPEFRPGTALVKVKYKKKTDDRGDSRVRFRHSFHEYQEYAEELAEHGLDRHLFPNVTGCLLRHDECVGFKPPANLFKTDFKRILPLLDSFTSAGVAVEDIRLTGSYAAGHAVPTSDYDMVITASNDKLRDLRRALKDLYASGIIKVPDPSSTWRNLSLWTNMTPDRLIMEERFCESFILPESNGLKCSLIYDCPCHQVLQIPSIAKLQRASYLGTVIDAEGALCKRSCYRVLTGDNQCITVISWHKVANALKEGDEVEIHGALDPGLSTLYQMDSMMDSIKILQ